MKNRNVSEYSKNNPTKRALDTLKGGRQYSPELKAYLISVAKQMRQRGMSTEDIWQCLGMWGGTLQNWLKEEETQ